MGQTASNPVANLENSAGCAKAGGQWDGSVCEFWASAAPAGQPYQSGSASCQYKLPGLTPIPGIPICGPGGYQAGQEACGGLPPSDPNYAACIQAQINLAQINNEATPAYIASLQQMIPVVAPTAAAPSPTLAPSSPVGQSNAPASTIVGSQGSPAQSNGPGTTTAIPLNSLAPTSGGCFALFGSSEPCLGPVGLYTLLAGAAAAALAFTMFGGHR